MSRSYRHFPVIGMTGKGSEKTYKALAHRSERRAVRALLWKYLCGDCLPHPKEFGNPWGGPKDGKQWLRNKNSKWMRK